MQKYRHKPLFVEAVQFDPGDKDKGNKYPGFIPWTKDRIPRDMSWGYLDTPDMPHVHTGNYIVYHLNGDMSLMPASIFETLYEKVEK